MDNQKFVRNIRNICKTKGISISQIENDLGWSTGLISRWTKACPSFEKVVDIVNYLGVSFESLLDDNVAPEGQPEAKQVVQKLTQMTKSGAITWHPCESNTIAAKIIAPLADMGGLVGQAFYFAYQEGWFFLVMTEDDLLPFAPHLYISADRNTAPVLESDDKASLGVLLSYVDNELYTSWTNSRNRQMVRSFLNDTF